MPDVDEFLGRYAARHYRFHAERSGLGDSGPLTAATTRISRGPLPEKNVRQNHGRRPLVFVVGILLVLSTAVPFLTRDDAAHPFQPGYGQPHRVIEREGYSIGVDPASNRFVSLWVSYRAVPSDGMAPGNKLKPDPDVPEKARLDDAFYKDHGFDRVKMLPARQAGALADPSDLWFMTLVAPHTSSALGAKNAIDKQIIELAGETGVQVTRGPIYGEHPQEKDGILIPDKYFCIAITDEKDYFWIYENVTGGSVYSFSRIDHKAGAPFAFPGIMWP